MQLGRDYGATVEVTAGLNPGETVAVHPGDDLPDGTVVEPRPSAGELSVGPEIGVRFSRSR